MSRFNSFLADLAETLASKKIEVLVAGKQAELCYDHRGKPSVLVLPEPVGKLDDDMLRLYNGYVDHEISHVEYTDINARREYKRKYEDSEMALFIGQVVEDCHIEIKRIQQWRGSESNLAAVFEFKLWGEYEQSFKPVTDLTSQIENFLAAAPAFLRSLSGLRKHHAFTAKHGATCPDVLRQLRDRITFHLEDSAKAMLVAEEIMLLLLEMYDQQQEDDDKEEQEDTDNDGEEQPEDPGEDEQEEQEEAEGAPENPQESTNGDSQGNARPLDLNLPEGDTGDVLSGLISQPENSEPGYSIFSTAYDRYFVNILDCLQEVGYKEILLNRMVLPDDISRMTSHLQRMIQGMSTSGWEGGKIAGHINPKQLSAFARGDDKVFRKRTTSQDKSAASMIVVDMSYSMFTGERMVKALEAAYALASVMHSSGVPCLVVGQTTVGQNTRGKLPLSLSNYISLESTTKFNRIQPLLVPEIKSWDEHPNSLKFSFGDVEELFMDNVDGEVIDSCCTILAERPESRKYLFVISDGQPDAINGICDERGGIVFREHLQQVVSKWEQRIKIGAIGIETDDVKDFYQNYAVVENKEGAASALIELFKSLVINN